MSMSNSGNKFLEKKNLSRIINRCRGRISNNLWNNLRNSSQQNCINLVSVSRVNRIHRHGQFNFSYETYQRAACKFTWSQNRNKYCPIPRCTITNFTLMKWCEDIETIFYTFIGCVENNCKIFRPPIGHIVVILNARRYYLIVLFILVHCGCNVCVRGVYSIT